MAGFIEAIGLNFREVFSHTPLATTSPAMRSRSQLSDGFQYSLRTYDGPGAGLGLRQLR
jgi:hypothetical protein